MSDKISLRHYVVLFTLIGIFQLTLFELCVGVSEAVFLHKYRQFSNQCQNVWILVLVSCILNISISVSAITIPLLTICDVTTYFKCISKNKKMSDNIVIQLIHLIPVGFMMLTVWIYQNISKPCYDFWESNANELLVFLMINVVKFYIFTIMSTMLTCFVIGMCVVLFLREPTIDETNLLESQPEQQMKEEQQLEQQLEEEEQQMKQTEEQQIKPEPSIDKIDINIANNYNYSN